MLRYRVHLKPDDNDTLLVTCPDLPEVTTFGETEADALMHAADAIATAIQGRISEREDIPVATDGEGSLVRLGAMAEAKVNLYRAMLRGGITKADLARRLQAHRPVVDRLLDLDHDSRFSQIEDAFKAIGRDVRIVDEAA